MTAHFISRLPFVSHSNILVRVLFRTRNVKQRGALSRGCQFDFRHAKEALTRGD